MQQIKVWNVASMNDKLNFLILTNYDLNSPRWPVATNLDRIGQVFFRRIKSQTSPNFSYKPHWYNQKPIKGENITKRWEDDFPLSNNSGLILEKPCNVDKSTPVLKLKVAVWSATVTDALEISNRHSQEARPETWQVRQAASLSSVASNKKGTGTD